MKLKPLLLQISNTDHFLCQYDAVYGFVQRLTPNSHPSDAFFSVGIGFPLECTQTFPHKSSSVPNTHLSASFNSAGKILRSCYISIYSPNRFTHLSYHARQHWGHAIAPYLLLPPQLHLAAAGAKTITSQPAFGRGAHRPYPDRDKKYHELGPCGGVVMVGARVDGGNHAIFQLQ